MIGKNIEHYEIVAQIGEGGMAEVYKAYDSQLDRFVAIKFLTRVLLRDKDAKKRFLREARAASSLNHPNITVIHEIGQHEGMDYIVMEFIDGVTLGDEIENGPLTPMRVVEIARQCASALSIAHASNVIHRDIKPDNIMFTKEGRVKIMDFGLAKTIHTTRITPPGYALGTPAYMSPEQAQRSDVDGRSDIFSLGVVMYQALTCDLPFKGDTEISMMYGVVHDQPKPLTSINAQVPKELAAVVDTCMAKKLEARYQTCEDLDSDLERVAEQLAQGFSDIPRSSALRAGVRRRNFKRLAVPSAIGVFIIALVVIFIQAILPVLYPQKPRLAVLPVQDGTEQKVLTTHNWTLAYALSTILGQSAQLEVIPHVRVEDAFTSLSRNHSQNLEIETLKQLAEMLQVKFLVWGLVNSDGDDLTLTARIVEFPVWKWDYVNSQAKSVAGLYKRLDSLTVSVRRRLEPNFSEMDSSMKSLAELTTFSPTALVRFTEAERLIGQFDIGPADVSLEKAVALDSTFPLANAFFALTRDYHGDHAKAEALLARAGRHLYNRPEKEKDLVQLLGAWICRDMESGLKLAIEMESRYPHDERVLVNVADMYWECNRRNDANRIFKKILKDNPWHLYTLDALASLKMEERNWDAAEKYLRQEVEVAPLVGNAYNSLGYFYLLRGRFVKAIKEFKNANLLRHGLASMNLGRAYELLGCFTQAEQYFRASLSNPCTAGEDVYAAQHLGKQMLKRGCLQDALDLFQAQLGVRPDDPSMLANVGIVLLAQNDATGCDSVSATLARIDSTQEWVHYLRAHRHLFAGQLESAIPELQSAVKLTECVDLFLAHEIKSQLAETYLKLGKVELALELYLELNENLPRRPYVLRGLAQCYAKKNRHRKAIRYYSELLDVWHSSTELDQDKRWIKAEIEKLQGKSHLKIIS